MHDLYIESLLSFGMCWHVILLALNVGSITAGFLALLPGENQSILGRSSYEVLSLLS